MIGVRDVLRVALLAAALAATAGLGGAQANDQGGGHGGVAEPDTYRMDDYLSPVPATLKGARVVSTEEAEALHEQRSAIFIDVFPHPPKPPNLPAGTVWRDPPHHSIEGAVWLPNVGYGLLAAEPEAYFRTRLDQLTGGDLARPVVIFCRKDCWMSWNAAKRAIAWGYSAIVWFPDGTDGWQEAGSDLVKVELMP